MIASIIDIGDVEEVLTVISRLQRHLPEYAKTATDRKFSEHWKAVEELQRQLAIRRALMREEASRIIANVKANWTAEEIETACGYPA